MNRDDVLGVVKKHMAEIVDGVDPNVVDPQRSMKELGANSLDIVEVVSCSMRELRVKVPRSELSKLTSINGLVDLLHETVRAKVALN